MKRYSELLSHPVTRTARTFAAISLAAWFGVIACGRVITAFRPPAWEWCAWCL